MGVLPPDRAPLGEPVGPGDAERDGVPALVGVDLVEPEGGPRRHRPAARVVRRGPRSADLVQARVVGVDVVALEQVHVVGGGPGDLALTRRAVVREEHEDRVVEAADRLELRDQATDVLVDPVHHRGVDLHVPGEQLLLPRVEVVPRPDVVVLLRVARGELQPLGHDPELLLAREPLRAQGVPPRVVPAAVLRHLLGPGVERRVHRTVREVQEERLLGIARGALAEHRDRVVGQVVGEVVAVRVPVDLDDVVVLHDPVRVVEVREGVEDAVEAVEAPLARPRVLRTGRRAVRVLGQVPLPHHHRGVARLVAQDLRDRRGVGGQLLGVPGEPRVEVRDRAEARPVGFETGQQGRARR